MGCSNSPNVGLSNQPYLKMNSGYKIPQYGLGVYQIEGDEATEKACLAAFEIGINILIQLMHIKMKEELVQQFKNVAFQENNFLLLQNYGFLTMVKALLLKQLTKCWKDYN